jgi:hypothetical protein
MTRAKDSSDQEKRRAAAVDEIVRDTGTETDVIKNIYDEEIVALNDQARITQYIQIIAIKRVKERLRDAGRIH